MVVLRMEKKAPMAKTFMEMVGDAQTQVSGVHASEVPETALVIDVRDRTDIAATGIVPGALAISLGTLGFKGDVTMPEEMQHPELGDHDREIVVTCTIGAMAALGAKTLQDLGYTNVTYMDGGTLAWKEAGLEVDAFTA